MSSNESVKLHMVEGLACLPEAAQGETHDFPGGAAGRRASLIHRKARPEGSTGAFYAELRSVKRWQELY